MCALTSPLDGMDDLEDLVALDCTKVGLAQGLKDAEVV